MVLIKFLNKQFLLPMHSFTQEDLLQYLYRETSAEKTKAIDAALENDYSLREKLEVIQAGLQRLEKLTLTPRKKAVDKVMDYAAKAAGALSTEA
jgi:hypothetical protein